MKLLIFVRCSVCSAEELVVIEFEKRWSMPWHTPRHNGLGHESATRLEVFDVWMVKS